MNRLSVAALSAAFAGALFAFAVQAQDPQKSAPKPEPAPAAAQEPAAKPQPGPGQEPDPQILEGIVNCLAEGLPQDWKKTWFVISEIDRDERKATRSFEANFFYATEPDDSTGRRLQTCGAERVIDGVKALNAYLTDSQQRWTGATFTFMRDGRFEAKYDFTPFKPAAAKPAAKPKAKSASKKKQEPAK